MNAGDQVLGLTTNLVSYKLLQIPLILILLKSSYNFPLKSSLIIFFFVYCNTAEQSYKFRY